MTVVYCLTPARSGCRTQSIVIRHHCVSPGMPNVGHAHKQRKLTMAPSKRRIRGEGSLYQRKGDGRWVGSFYSEEGKRISVYGDTQKEALEKLKAAQREY